MASRRPGTTAMLSVRVDGATLDALDIYAEGRGGRSAVLRRLILETLEMQAEAPRLALGAEPPATRISLRLTETENAVLAHRAAKRGTSRSGWIKALVRRHLGLRGRVDDALLDQLAPIRMQLLRIGRNLNQAMKAANIAMLPDGDRQIAGELRRIADMREEIAEHIAAVGDAMKGDTGYWSVPD